MTLMKITKTMRRRLLATAALTLIGAAGCELAVDFDRTKIDAGAIDASIPESGGDTTIPVDGSNEAAADAANDADAAQAIDTGVDANDGAVAVDADDGGFDADDGE
jgi:hypothetical protein